MINKMLKDVSKIYIAYGATDFREQIYSLCFLVRSKFNLNIYDNTAFIFCNKKEIVLKFYVMTKMGLY